MVDRLLNKWRGHAAARAYMSDWLEGFELHPMGIAPAGATEDGRLVCSLHGEATERRSGLSSTMRFAGVFSFSPDGRIAEIHSTRRPRRR